MVNRYMDGDAAANLLERRWFAAFKAASGVRAECEALLESMARAQVAWSRARARLAELETLRGMRRADLRRRFQHGDVGGVAPAGVGHTVYNARR